MFCDGNICDVTATRSSKGRDLRRGRTPDVNPSLDRCRGATCGETLSVPTQHADEGVSVLVADFVVLVAVAIVETGLARAALHGAQGAASSRSGDVATKAQRTGGLVW